MSSSSVLVAYNTRKGGAPMGAERGDNAPTSEGVGLGRIKIKPVTILCYICYKLLELINHPYIS